MKLQLGHLNSQLKDQHGVVLLITLWVLIILGIIALQLSSDVRRDLYVTRANRGNLIALNVARTGIGIAVTNLKNDQLVDWDPEEEKSYDSLADVWKQEPDFEEPLPVSDGEVWFRVIDQESKLNINLASGELIYRALLYLEIDEGEAAVLATAIVDWRDSDSDVSFINDEAKDLIFDLYEPPEDDQFGDEAEATGKILEKDFYGRVYRNENILVMEELLQVWGVTPYLLYGHDPEHYVKPPYPFPILHDRDSVPSDFDKLDLGLVHLFTTSPTAGVNLNTATFDVLMIYFSTAFQEVSDARELAERVVRWREDSNDSFSKTNLHVFTEAPDFSKVPDLSNRMNQFIEHHRFTLKSNHFMIYSMGLTNNSTAYVAAEVVRSNLNDSRYHLDPEDQEARQNPPAGPDPSNEDDWVWIPSVRCTQWYEW